MSVGIYEMHIPRNNSSCINISYRSTPVNSKFADVMPVVLIKFESYETHMPRSCINHINMLQHWFRVKHIYVNQYQSNKYSLSLESPQDIF